MQSAGRRSTKPIRRRRQKSTVAFQCQILLAVMATILFLQEAGLDRPSDVVRGRYLLVGANPGNQRQPEPGITIEEDARNVSGPPGSVKIKHDGVMHEIIWQGTRDDTILGYQVYRRCQHEPWQGIGFIRLREDDPRNAGVYTFKDHYSENCEYTVAAVGPDGKPGPMSVDIQ